MSDFLGLIGAIGAGEAPRVGDKVEIAGLTISTIHSYDMGYETAILDRNGAHPVERYPAEEQATAGHRKWIAAAPTLVTITKLGYGDLVDDEVITLAPEGRS